MDLDENPPDAFWDWSPALTPATPVRVVSAAGGLVVAAGDALHMLRPGSQRFRSRDLGADLGVIAVAAEPWSPFRLAIASPMHLGVYSGHQPHDPEVDVTLPGSAYDATHLAWVRHDGETLLYYRQRSGDVSRLRFEGATESITVPKTQAVAADEAGNLALITLVPSDDAAVWSLPAGGKEWDIRGMVSVPVGEDDDETAAFEVHLAAHGTAVAFSMDDCGAEVSWKEHEDETKHFVSPPPSSRARSRSRAIRQSSPPTTSTGRRASSATCGAAASRASPASAWGKTGRGSPPPSPGSPGMPSGASSGRPRPSSGC